MVPRACVKRRTFECSSEHASLIDAWTAAYPLVYGRRRPHLVVCTYLLAIMLRASVLPRFLDIASSCCTGVYRIDGLFCRAGWVYKPRRPFGLQASKLLLLRHTVHTHTHTQSCRSGTTTPTNARPTTPYVARPSPFQMDIHADSGLRSCFAGHQAAP